VPFRSHVAAGRGLPTNASSQMEPVSSAYHRYLIPAIRIGAFFLAFLLLTLCEYTFRQQLGPFINGTMTVRPATWVVNLLDSTASVHATGDLIQSPMARIRVAQGCEGIDVMFMFAAAIGCSTLGWRRRASAGVVGVAVIYFCNLMRVAGLWFCARYWPTHFEAMHVIVGQTAIIVIALVLFAGWTLGWSSLMRLHQK
jgi:exosortase/archaeosortase family protein